MNFLFANNASSNAVHPTIGLDKQGVTSAASTTHSPPMQDIELVIDIDSSFHGVLLGLPEESPGAVLNATAILHVRKKPIKASKLTATFDGRIKVQCSDGATFGPEQYRERVLAHKDWTLWEAGGNNTHSGSKNHIPVGTHYYPLSIQLDGALPPTFSGKHGSIRYILSTSLLRPIFHSDINTVQEIEIKRCLVSEASESSTVASHDTPLDLGSLLVNQLSRAGISGSSNGADSLVATPAEQPLGPTTITHHNTYKESLRYTATSPPIAHLEGGLIYVDLALEPLPPGSYIYSIAYGLKESIYYRSSATGNLADNKSEILYPIGQQTVIVPRDQERERIMASAGAGASTRQLLELRPCPLLTNVDITTPLVEIQHRITCNVAIVLPDSSKRCNSTSPGNGEQSSGRLLRRLNLASQPQAPNLNLVDSSGTEATNNAVLLGEPTHSIIEPALVPANIELNGAPPPPPPSQLETIMLEFPIILTSRYPSSPRPSYLTSMSTTTPISFPTGHSTEEISHGNGEECAYQALAGNSYSSQLASSLSLAPTLSDNEPSAQFVHNREISPTIIPTTGTTVPSHTSVPMSTETISASPSSSCSSFPGQGPDSGYLSSTLPFHTSPLEAPDSRDSYTSISAAVVRDAPTATRAPMQSGISAGLRAAAAAAAAAAATPATTAPANESNPISPPPSYGRQARSSPTTAVPEPRAEELPKYEDVVDSSDAVLSSGLGITIPTTTPIPMPMQVPQNSSRSSYSQSVAARLMARSSSPGQVFSASPPPLSPALPSNDGFEQGSSPRSIRTRSGSTTSVLHSTSLARSPGQSLSSVMSMTPIQQHQAQVQAQFQRQHQRQRSGGVATIIGSLGCNGGYLSQQPAPLCMPDLAGTPSSFYRRNASPPTYTHIPRSETFSYTFPSLFLTLTHRSSQKRLHERRGRNATAEPLTVSSTTAINSPLTSFTVSVTTPHQQPPEPAPSRGYHTTTIHSVMNTSSGRLHPPTSASSLTRSALPEGGEGGRGGRGGVEEGGGGISLGSASAQFTSDSLGALNRIQESLPENVQPWFWQGLWFAFTVLILGLIIRFSPTILAFLEFIALSIKGLGPWGPLVLMFALFATSFPPIIGYSSCVTMSGYVYGFMNGFLMAFSSAWLGSIVCFYFCRRWFKVHVRKLMTKNKSLKAVVRTVEKKGFRLLLLIRLAPYPFNIMNALLSATHIPLYTFALATGLSLLKLMLFVYIGSTLSSLAGNDGNDDDTPKNPDEVHGHKLQKVAMILGIILGIGVGGYVWLIASREVEKSEALRIERRRRRREAGLRRALNERLGFDFASSGGTGMGHGGNGIELTDQNYGLGSDLDREDASLFDRLETGRGESGQATTTGWRDVVDMGGDSFADSEEEEDSSDSFDDDDDEEEEEEEDDDGDQDVFLGGLGGRSGYRSVGQNERQDERNREDEELDFSAHFTGLDRSPWQEDETVDATDTADAGFEATMNWPSIDSNADPESIDNDDDGRGR